MARLKRREGSVAIDTVPLPEKILGMKTRKGIISKVGSKYYFKAAGRKSEIPMISQQEARKLVGKQVYAAFSRKKPGEIVAIGTWPTPEMRKIIPRWIICYIPAPDMIRRIDPAIRKTLFDSMLDEGIITQKLESMIKNGNQI